MRTKRVLSKVNILPDDIFLVSFPRSGNTWTSLLLSNYVSEVNYDEQGISSSVVSELYHIPADVLARKPSPRVIKIHAPFEESLPRVIYLVRDGRDVAVSYYYFYLKNKGEITFEDYLERFNAGTLNNFGLWNYHVNSWLDQREKSDNFLLVRYEDLKMDPHQQLSRMVKFIWGEVDSNRIDIAVKSTEISRLQKSEEKANWFPDSDQDIKFFRKGIVGDWKNHFSPDLLKEFMLFHGRGLKRLDYTQSEGKGLVSEPSEAVNLTMTESSELENFDLQLYRQQSDRYTLKEQLYETKELLKKERQKLKSSNLLTPKEQPQSQRTTNVQRKLEKEKKRVQTLRKRLNTKVSLLRESRKQLRIAQERIQVMESSKFWKVRSFWVRLKIYLGLAKH